jgi:hypothetical protein
MEAILNLPGLMKGSSLSSGRAKAGEERALAGDGSYIESTWSHEGILTVQWQGEGGGGGTWQGNVGRVERVKGGIPKDSKERLES